MTDWIIEGMIMALAWFIHVIQPLVVPASFIAAWFILVMAGLSIVSFFRDGLKRAKAMHTIPCANCRYFTGDYHLKCSVHPSKALSEAAINCMDYEEQPFGVYS
ncbi:MAG: hypothetical protein AAGA75_27625 [Cyanobacteria bacterium P01_E01_bin.6]